MCLLFGVRVVCVRFGRENSRLTDTFSALSQASTHKTERRALVRVPSALRNVHVCTHQPSHSMLSIPTVNIPASALYFLSRRAGLRYLFAGRFVRELVRPDRKLGDCVGLPRTRPGLLLPRPSRRHRTTRNRRTFRKRWRVLG